MNGRLRFPFYGKIHLGFMNPTEDFPIFFFFFVLLFFMKSRKKIINPNTPPSTIIHLIRLVSMGNIQGVASNLFAKNVIHGNV